MELSENVLFIFALYFRFHPALVYAIFENKNDSKNLAHNTTDSFQLPTKSTTSDTFNTFYDHRLHLEHETHPYRKEI